MFANDVHRIRNDAHAPKMGKENTGHPVPTDEQLATERNRLQTQLIEIKVRELSADIDGHRLSGLHDDLEVITAEIMRRARARHPSSMGSMARSGWPHPSSD